MKNKMPIVIWLAALPAGEAEAAQKAAERWIAKGELVLNPLKDTNSLASAVALGFLWSSTEEGVSYWFDVYLREFENEKLK